MSENYFQYVSGYQKDNIVEADLEKAIIDIQLGTTIFIQSLFTENTKLIK